MDFREEDGFYENVVSGEDFGGGEGYGLSLTSLYEPTDAVRVKLRLSWTDDEYEPGAVAVLNDRTIQAPVPEDAAEVTDETEATLLPRVGSASGLQIFSSEDPLNGSRAVHPEFIHWLHRCRHEPALRP